MSRASAFTTWTNRRQVVLADKIPDDNSFFSPFTRTLTLGTGGVDDGEDADVISHEYGHSIQNSESPAFLRSTSLEAGSLAEGSADYMAAVMSAQDRGTTNTDDVCIFDWDAQTWGTLFPSLNRHCGRRADNPSTLSQEESNQRDCSNGFPTGPIDIHCVGTVWSSALWKLRQSIGLDSAQRAVMDRDMIASQFMYKYDERFRSAAKALLAADGDLYGGAHQAAIETEMIDRGICPSTGCRPSLSSGRRRTWLAAGPLAEPRSLPVSHDGGHRVRKRPATGRLERSSAAR